MVKKRDEDWEKRREHAQLVYDKVLIAIAAAEDQIAKAVEAEDEQAELEGHAAKALAEERAKILKTALIAILAEKEDAYMEFIAKTEGDNGKDFITDLG